MSEVYLPTVGGQVNALVIDGNTPKILQYVAELTQAGAAAPTAVEIINDFGASPVYSYVGNGRYDGTLAGAFDVALNYSARFDIAVLQKTVGSDPLGNSQPTLNTGNADTFRIVTSEWVANQVAPYPIDQLLSDDVLRGQRLFIQQFATAVPTDSETSFAVILSKLDANQLKLWTKIVVRFGGTVVEVSGEKYRRLGTYALSSKIIQS